MNVQSGCQSLVIVNVHLEPELTLRSLRERQRFITPHWPQHPDGLIIDDFNVCEPEEGRFNVWNQTFTDGDMEKAALFHSLFPRVLEIAQPDYTRDSVNGVIRTLSRIDRALTNIPVAEARDFHCYSHVFENLGKRSIRVTTQLYVWSFKNRPLGDMRANAFRVECPNIPFSVLF